MYYLEPFYRYFLVYFFSLLLLLVTSSVEFQSYELDKIMLNDEKTLLIFMSYSVGIPSLFRPLFIETLIILYYLVKFFRLTLVIN